jgi:hypothetical protein
MSSEIANPRTSDMNVPVVMMHPFTELVLEAADS